MPSRLFFSLRHFDPPWWSRFSSGSGMPRSTVCLNCVQAICRRVQSSYNDQHANIRHTPGGGTLVITARGRSHIATARIWYDTMNAGSPPPCKSMFSRFGPRSRSGRGGFRGVTWDATPMFCRCFSRSRLGTWHGFLPTPAFYWRAVPSCQPPSLEAHPPCANNPEAIIL